MVELSETDIKEIYEVREALEGMAARLAAVKILPDELERLQQLFASIIEDGSVANVEHMEKIGDELHQAILQGAGNARAARLLNLMNGQLDLIRMMGRAVALGTLQARRSALKEHLEILRALANHDPDAAEEAMRRHLRNSKVRILTAQLLPGESFDFLQERSG